MTTNPSAVRSLQHRILHGVDSTTHDESLQRKTPVERAHGPLEHGLVIALAGERTRRRAIETADLDRLVDEIGHLPLRVTVGASVRVENDVLIGTRVVLTTLLDAAGVPCKDGRVAEGDGVTALDHIAFAEHVGGFSKGIDVWFVESRNVEHSSMTREILSLTASHTATHFFQSLYGEARSIDMVA